MTAKHYKDAYVKLLNELPKWKQLAIKEDSIKNKWSGILTEFIANVIITAEKEFELSPVDTVEKQLPIESVKSKEKPKKQIKKKI